MSRQLDRRTLTRWLTGHGFQLVPGRATGHLKYRHDSGVTVTVLGHGPQDVTKKHAGMILRTLTRAGFDPDTVKREWQQQ